MTKLSKGDTLGVTSKSLSALGCSGRRSDTELLVAELETQLDALRQENLSLRNICVASYQLHGALDRMAVLGAIEEIVIDLIGSEELVVYEVDPTATLLSPVSAFGMDSKQVSDVPLGQGIIGGIVQTAALFLGSDSAVVARVAGEEHLTACVPLRVAGKVTGAIAVFALLDQKTHGLTAADRELLGFLAAHAGLALQRSSQPSA